ncbi:TonB-dependent receptor [Hyphomicrobium sp.]|uniref:TonB-dependent receptor n=1 Tax=Hyphomicrobium sp. TaxID=82 RepID=UPI003F6FE46B
MHGIKLTTSSLALLFAAGWVHPVIAQEAGAPAEQAETETIELPGLVVEAPAKRNVRKEKLRKSAPQQANQPVLEQQVVEGEKITRTLRDTTTSVGIVSGQDIEERQIRDLDEAVGQAANVVTSEDPNSGFAIRGMNSEGQTGNQHISAVPLVGVVIDGATQNSDAVRRGARALWDIDQVEVLRGPQSTLQGRNSLGGAVIVKTNDPTYKLGGVVEGTIGTNDLYGTGFVLNAPIVAGQSAFRLSGYKTERERDISYTEPKNAEMGTDAYDTLRGKLLIEPDALPGFSALFTISHTNDEPGSAFVSGPDFFARELTYSAAFTDFREGTADNYVSDLSYEFMPGLTIRSVTAYADTLALIKTPIGAAFARDGDHTDGSDFTQDVRLEIDNQGNGISGVLGVFYGRFSRDNFSNQTANLGYFFGGPDNYVPYGTGTVAAETSSLAAYADLRYRLDRWSLIAGGRLLRDTVETTENTIVLNTNTFTYDVNDNYTKETFNEFLPKLGITYDLTVNETVGLTYNKGYRTGFQQIVRLPIGDRVSSVDPEYLDAYELSYRSNWLNKTLEFNANAFYYDYTDQQVVVLDNVYNVSEFFNAGSSHAYGAEFEARWKPLRELQLFANLGLIQSNYDELDINGVDFAGKEYPEAPAYTFAVGAMYRSAAGWFAGANVRHTDGYFSFGNIANISERAIDAYTVVDASVGWEWEQFTLTLFAKNLFDEKYLTSVDTRNNPPLSPAYGFIGDERTVGMTLTGRF